jgi:hypothetical protein
MISTLVYQLGYDSDSDQEFLITTGLFVCYTNDPVEITALANHHWGTDWFGLAYQAWDCNDLNVERKRVFRKAA